MSLFSNKLNRPIVVAVDFDGTVVDHAFPHIGEIRNQAKQCLQLLTLMGCKLVLWTCRGHVEGGELTPALDFIKRELPLVEFASVNKNIPDLGFETSEKVYADVYVDDRMIGTIPTWKEIVDDIMKKFEFKCGYSVDEFFNRLKLADKMQDVMDLKTFRFLLIEFGLYSFSLKTFLIEWGAFPRLVEKLIQIEKEF